MAQVAGTPHAAARAVAVVGAGAAGLVAARELRRDGHAVSVFEKSSRAGGTWAYDPRADADPLSGDPGAPGAVHGSLYASLRTNLPRELMGLSGFPLAGRVFAGDPRTFPGHQEVLAFLDAFAEETGVAARVRFRAEVLRVAPLGQGLGSEQWEVRWRGDDGVVAEEVFDAVVVCIGHNTVPLVPKIRGIDKWRGKQIHSHNYRIPEPFRDQIVVVVGLGASGIDIAREISRVAKEVHIASRYSQDRLGKVELYQNTWMHDEVPLPFPLPRPGRAHRRRQPRRATVQARLPAKVRAEPLLHRATIQEHRLPRVRAGGQVGGRHPVRTRYTTERGRHAGRRARGLPPHGEGRDAEAPHARAVAGMGGVLRLARGPGGRAVPGGEALGDVREGDQVHLVPGRQLQRSVGRRTIVARTNAVVRARIEQSIISFISGNTASSYQDYDD